jgi:hypothetical protein
MRKRRINMKHFGSYANGFTLKFDNGLVLSTRFGFGNYCENSGLDSGVIGGHREQAKDQIPLFSEDCEVGVWDSTSATFDVDDPYANLVEELEHRDWVTGWQTAIFKQEDADDDVRGWVSFSDWLKIVEWCEQKEK